MSRKLNFSYFNLPIVDTPLINEPLVYNTPYTQPLLAIGGTGSYTWALNTPLPPGLSLNTGDRRGQRHADEHQVRSRRRSRRLTLAATRARTSSPSTSADRQTTTLGFSSGPSLGTPQQGFTTSSNVTPTGGTAPYTVTALTALPPGFAILSGDSLLASGAAGSFAFCGNAADIRAIQLHAAGDGRCRATSACARSRSPSFRTRVFQTTLHDGTVGVPYSQQVIAWNGGGLTWTPSLTSPLPARIEHLAVGCDKRHTAESAGTFSFSAVASDAATGTALTSFFSLRISKLGDRRSTGAAADRNRRTAVQLSVHRIRRGQRRLVCHGASATGSRCRPPARSAAHRTQPARSTCS